MLKIFDNKNVHALQTLESTLRLQTQGTQTFLQWAFKLWQILNTNSPKKHFRFREPNFKPIQSNKDPNFLFIKNTISWLQDWQNLKIKPRHGYLSNETMFSLEHTLKTLLDLCVYLICEKGFSYYSWENVRLTI